MTTRCHQQGSRVGVSLYSKVPYPGRGRVPVCMVRSNALWVMVTWMPSHPIGQNDGQTQLKTLPSHNLLSGGRYINQVCIPVGCVPAAD